MQPSPMSLLRELLYLSADTDKYNDPKRCDNLSEQVDNIVTVGQDYVPMVSPKRKSKRKRVMPTTDKAENSLINTLWFYNNSDAS